MEDDRSARNNPAESLPALAMDGIKIVATFALGAATYFGSPFSKVLHDHWFTFALGAGLLASLYIIYRRERRATRSLSSSGVVRFVARRDELNQGAILDAFRNAKTIDMLGFNLRSQWLKYPSTFDDVITMRLKTETGLQIRILIADPDCESLSERDVFETGAKTGRLSADAHAVKNYLYELRKRSPRSGAVEVRFVDANWIRCSLIIADDHMFATWYLSFRGGSQSPTLELAGGRSPFFVTFRQEFETLWQRGRSMDDPE
jgi:hypothetical protein